MREVESHTEAVETVIVTRVTMVCNKCGKRRQLEPWKEGESWDAQEYYEISFRGGYGSRHFGDMAFVSFHLCEQCLHEIAESCLIAPEIEGG